MLRRAMKTPAAGEATGTHSHTLTRVHYVAEGVVKVASYRGCFGSSRLRFFRSCSSEHRTAETPLPAPALPRTARRGFRLFDWSSDFPPAQQSSHLSLTSSLVIQQQEISTNTSRSTPEPPPGQDRPDSPLSQDSGYWSQSQPHQRPYYQKEDAAVVG